MKSNTYKPYTPPEIEIAGVEMESAVLTSSTTTGTSTDSLDNDTFTW